MGTKKGQGTTNVMMKYSYVDENIQLGKGYYYRIKQIDYDGDFTFSKVLYIKSLEANSSLTVFPNPIAVGFPIHFEVNNIQSHSKATLYDINGRQMLSLDVPPTNHYQGIIPTDNLSQGIYFLELSGNNFVRKIKIIVY